MHLLETQKRGVFLLFSKVNIDPDYGTIFFNLTFLSHPKRLMTGTYSN